VTSPASTVLYAPCGRHPERGGGRWQEEAKATILRAKGTTCSDCGGEFGPRELHFHHAQGQKLFSVSRFWQAGRSLEVLRAEIAKCVVVCGRCHLARQGAKPRPRCSACGQRFRWPGELERHEATHHPATTVNSEGGSAWA
jgi:hypothetical protein